MSFKNKIFIIIGRYVSIATRILNRAVATYQLSKISNKGNCYINGPGYFTYKNIFLGRNVYLGVNTTFMAAESRIIIKDNVVFGPHCFIIGGNHRYDVVGTLIIDVHEKRPQDDGDVVIDEDCWIGTNVIILKGVHIGRGCVIGAGSIVTKPIPPYSIFTNNGLRPRFAPEQIAEHERLLYH